MKAHKRAFLTVVIALAALVVGAATVQAQAISTPVSGTEGLCEGVTNPVTKPGTEVQLPSGNIAIRDREVSLCDETSNDRTTGHNTIVLNADLHNVGGPGPDAVYVGPMWGTWQLTPDKGGGSWAGHWSGMQTGTGSIIHAEGAGAEGYAGMKYFLYLKDGAIQGRILAPHRAKQLRVR